jgi:ABC-type lipoprotein release transport system permease subunit
MPPPPGAANPLDLQLLLRPADFAAVILLMVAVLTLAAVVPCWRVGRMRIVEALGHV